MGATMRERAAWLGRLLYTKNPFYLLSAACVLRGVDLALDNVGSWTLMALLAGYALLMAAWATVIIRAGQVWDDARSILLILVLLLLALSVSFDDTLLAESRLGARLANFDLPAPAAVLLAGWTLAILLSEGVLRGLRLRLRLWYRLTYHLLLALFFIYPLGMAAMMTYVSPRGQALVTGESISRTAWGVLLFPTLAAAIFLLLLPAVRRGAAYVADNGSPWRWPWFPMPVFAMLALGVGLRSFYLSVSFHPVDGVSSAFGLYFLVPLVLVILLLVLEAGLATRREAVQFAAIALAPLALLISIPQGTGEVFNALVAMLSETLAAPPMLTLLALVAFYGYAWLRGVRFAAVGCLASLGLLSVVNAQTIGFETLVVPQALPVYALAAVLVVWAMAQSDSQHWFAAVAACIAALAVSLRGSWLTADAGICLWHLLLVAMCGVGLTFEDRFARWLRGAGALLLVALCLRALLVHVPLVPSAPAWVETIYVGSLIAAAIALWRASDEAAFLFAGIASTVFSVASLTLSAYPPVRDYFGARAFWALLAGLGLFACAALISAFKAGLHERLPDAPPWLARLRGGNGAESP